MEKNNTVEKVADNRIATLKPGDFLILSEIQNYTPNKEYKVNVLFYTEYGLVPQRIIMEVSHFSRSEPMDAVVTREGAVGYVLNIKDDGTEGPQLPNLGYGRYCDKYNMTLSTPKDFVMFAGIEVRPGDFVRAIYPSWKEHIKETVSQLLGRRVLDVMYVITSEAEEKGKVSLINGFTVKSVRTEGKNQRIHTTDGRTGINLISYNGGRKYQEYPINPIN